MTDPARVGAVVIGGGISGLACLWRLERRGIDALLLEADDRVGGAIRTDRSGGFLAEAGPNTVPAASEVRTLAEEVGLGPEMLEADARSARYVYRRGRLHRVPLGPLALARTSLLSLGGKLRLLREPWIPARGGDEEESVRDFVVRRFGIEPHETLVAPMVSGIFAGDPAKLGIEAAFPEVAALERRYGSVIGGLVRRRGRQSSRRGLMTFRDGFQTLTARLGERLEERIRRGARVRTVRILEQGFEIIPEQGAILQAESVIVATSADVAGELLREAVPAVARELGAIPFAPLAVVSVAYQSADVPRALDGFGFLVPRGEGVRLLGCLWVSSLFTARAPEGWVTLTVFVGGATDPEAVTLGDDDLVRIVREGLAITLGIRSEPRPLALHRYPRAIPQYAPGHGRRLAAIEAGLARAPGLFLAGNYLRGVSLGECIRSAEEAAARVDKRRSGEGSPPVVDFRSGSR